MGHMKQCCQRASGLGLVVLPARPTAGKCLPSQRRTFFHDPEPTRKAYLERIHRGLGTDGHGQALVVDPVSKTVSTAVGPLPISPLMDPAWLEATRRYYKELKAKERRPEGRFRKKLSRNPYALALATPLRRCHATGTTVPRFFLQGMTLVTNPETQTTWWAPKDIAFRVAPEDGDDAERVVIEKRAGHESGEAEDYLVEEGGGEQENYRADESPTGERQEVLPAAPDSPDSPDSLLPKEDTPPVAHSSDDIVTSDTPHSKSPATASSSTSTLAKPQNPLYAPTSWLLLRHASLTPQNSKGLKMFLPNWVALSAKAIYREDMHDFVLKLRRRYVVDQLLYFARLNIESGRQALTPCPSWAAVQDYVFRGCVLWLDEYGGVESGAGDSDGDSDDTNTTITTAVTATATRTSYYSSALPAKNTVNKTVNDGIINPVKGTESGAPGVFATIDIPGQQFSSKIPVHNLAYLLGDEFVVSLREGSSLFRDNQLLMLGRRRSIELQQALWQLQGMLLPTWAKKSQKREK